MPTNKIPYINAAGNKIYNCIIKQPPLGIIPKKLWYESRMEELSSCINRYLKYHCKLNKKTLHWIYELNELSNRYAAEFECED